MLDLNLIIGILTITGGLMIQYVLITLVFTATSDSLLHQPEIKRKDYSHQILINGLFSAGFGISAAVFHTQGNKAYNDYQSSTTIADALDNWNRVKNFDLYRNVCIAGSLGFFIRFIYYHMKHTEPLSQTGLLPLIDIRYSSSPKFTIGLHKKL